VQKIRVGGCGYIFDGKKKQNQLGNLMMVTGHCGPEAIHRLSARIDSSRLVGLLLLKQGLRFPPLPQKFLNLPLLLCARYFLLMFCTLQMAFPLRLIGGDDIANLARPLCPQVWPLRDIKVSLRGETRLCQLR
jgi:hypothetical protein